MAAQIAGVFEESLQKKITNSKVLVVGAGGIGCEVLKNLVLSGFGNIEIIDMDTIDVSNLNRQFLFHKEHVGKSKSEVARDSALSFNPNANIKAYHGSITSPKFGLSFYEDFDLVLNALDNRQARNHVNRMCLTADIPLIESGTAGYNGQVELIKKGLTQCYECQAKAPQKSYPGCTIRNTPSEPIHCIVWAKHLFNQLFGENTADEDVSPDREDPQAEGKIDTDKEDDSSVQRISTRMWAENAKYDPETIFNKLFDTDIKYLLAMENLWQTRTPPTPIVWGVYPEPAAKPTEETPAASVLPDQRIWSLSECSDFFKSSVNALKDEVAKQKPGEFLVWDKDEKASMDFVATCANIRAIVFGIAQKSRFEIKSMAGNIIPAIATTNAITAGIVVLRAFQVLQEQLQKCRSVYIRLKVNGRNQFLVPDKYLEPPNPECYVCAPKPLLFLRVDTTKMTVKAFRDDVLIRTLNMVEPDVMLEGLGIILISSEEGETDCNNDKLLSEMNIVDDTQLKVDDFFQNFELNIRIKHKDAERDDDALFKVLTKLDMFKPKPEEKKETETIEKPKNGNSETVEVTDTILEDDDDDMCIVEDPDDDTAVTSPVSPPKKRKTADESGPSAKRSKVLEDSDNDLTVIED